MASTAVFAKYSLDPYKDSKNPNRKKILKILKFYLNRDFRVFTTSTLTTTRHSIYGIPHYYHNQRLFYVQQTTIIGVFLEHRIIYFDVQSTHILLTSITFFIWNNISLFLDALPFFLTKDGYSWCWYLPAKFSISSGDQTTTIRPYLVPKIFKIFQHIESLNAYIKTLYL
jgi:hypothetical protein